MGQILPHLCTGTSPLVTGTSTSPSVHGTKRVFIVTFENKKLDRYRRSREYGPHLRNSSDMFCSRAVYLIFKS